jgi:membrane fusion protein (multidrug efflux system)
MEEAATLSAPVAEPVAPPTRARWRGAVPPVIALALAALIVVALTGSWTRIAANRRWQSTDDAYVRGDLTPMNARVGGYVRRVLVGDYQPVSVGQPLVEIADDDYRAQLAQAQANLAGADAAIANNLAQQRLQQATIAAAAAAVQATRADLTRYALDAARQRTMAAADAASQAAVETAEANLKRTDAGVVQGSAQVAAARRQLDVLRTQAGQLAAARDAQGALVRLARITLGYTRITAPAAGYVGERQVRPGQLVAAGTQVITVVPAPDLWVVANFKETQLGHVRAGLPATVSVDSFPGVSWRGHVAALSPASGSQFALLPPDNASGNFTKVVQRVPVRIMLDAGGPAIDRLRPGLSVHASIDTGAH